MSDSEGGPPIKVFQQILAQNYTNVALVALLFWDHITTLDREVELVWSTRWSLGKILFILNRYIPAANLFVLLFSYTYPSFPINGYAGSSLSSYQAVTKSRSCVAWSIIDDWLSLLSMAVVDVLLMLRITAMWDRNKIVRWILLPLFIITMGGMTAAIVNITVTAKQDEFPPSIRPCVVSFENTHLASTFFYSSMFFDTTIMLLTVARLVPMLRAGTLGPLLKVLQTDGYIYFAVLFMTATANIIVLQLASGPAKAMLITLHRVSSAMMCSRMVLNMRSHLLVQTQESTHTGQGEIELTKISIIDFARVTTRTEKSSTTQGTSTDGRTGQSGASSSV
ncbi:hypothetical protein EXIGLDRAFT_759683 [Exidia glandulosa HHB12029]|uniref:DUF6533 domain-containing protein n=1 Tax=Exidia glandulosa HHB12029 TaxID=1314781 RepID=A0A165PR63_EXIGL|nr:hypothetical protein EXIGLDRAFT_759683 [Exidia glandulosa HHB12029]